MNWNRQEVPIGRDEEEEEEAEEEDKLYYLFGTAREKDSVTGRLVCLWNGRRDGTSDLLGEMIIVTGRLTLPGDFTKHDMNDMPQKVAFAHSLISCYYKCQ
jgi:hypothetical protein